MDNWTTEAISRAKLQSNQSSPSANQHTVFLQARCRSCRQANSVKALKGNVEIIFSDK